MKIFDKASWQIDNGIPSITVHQHFALLFFWLDSKGLLSDSGKEILDLGMDDSVSLNESYVLPKGAVFLDKVYDTLIEQSNYNVSVERKLLDELYENLMKNEI